MTKPISVRVVDALRDGPMSESALMDVLHIDRISDSVVAMQLTSLVAARTIQKVDNLYSLHPLEDDDDQTNDGAVEMETEQTVHRSETMTVRKRGRPPKTDADRFTEHTQAVAAFMSELGAYLGLEGDFKREAMIKAAADIRQWCQDKSSECAELQAEVARLRAASAAVAALAETNAQPPALPAPAESEVENDIGIFDINHVLKLQDVDGKVHRIEMTSEAIFRLSVSLHVLTDSSYFEAFM
jgi:hypothetical protein